MSYTAIGVEEVIIKASACIEDIRKTRAAFNKIHLAAEVNRRQKINNFWNKITIGLVKHKSWDCLSAEADKLLRYSEFGIGSYPDMCTHGMWMKRAFRLISLAKKSKDGMVYVDDEDIFIIRWCESEQ